MSPSVPHKRCTKCGEEKPLDLFPPAAGKRDGLSSWCRACTNAQRRERYQNDPEYKERYKTKPREYYHKNADYRDRMIRRGRGEHVPSVEVPRSVPIQDDTVAMARYKDRQGKRDRNRREWYQKNRLKRRSDPQKLTHMRLIGRLARQRQRGKQRQYPSTLTVDQWHDILKQQDNKCLACHREFGPQLKPTMDHVIPLNDGAALSYENCQALCRSCNASKGAKHIDYRPAL